MQTCLQLHVASTSLRSGQPGFNSRLFATVPRPALEPSHDSWVGTGDSAALVKCPGRESDHSPPSDAVFKNACSYTSIPPIVFMVWCLIKHGIYLYGVILS
jgi:hypothetical protein